VGVASIFVALLLIMYTRANNAKETLKSAIWFSRLCPYLVRFPVVSSPGLSFLSCACDILSVHSVWFFKDDNFYFHASLFPCSKATNNPCFHSMALRLIWTIRVIFCSASIRLKCFVTSPYQAMEKIDPALL
jgi:hypothetical protein